MTCSDCIHHEVCENAYCWIDPNDSNKYITCYRFKPKSRFIELPCAVGEKIYDISEFVLGVVAPDIYELQDNVMYIEKGKDGAYNFTYDGMYINKEDIGERLFFTKEEAEKALERSEGK